MTIEGWESVPGDLTAARGFRAGAVSGGIKKGKDALDLALIFSDGSRTTAAGMFTTNLVAAAPVIVSQHHLERSFGRARAVVVNSGNANAGTGREGLRTALDTARTAAKLLNLEPEQVLVASTGVIGVPLNAKLILDHLPALCERLSRENASKVAEAIMTTDTFPKSFVLRSAVDGRAVHIAGIAKGAGMIHPHLATLLSFITTDVNIGPRVLRDALRTAVDASFNLLTVDGETSTNDTVLIFASGLSEIPVRPGTPSRAWFLAGLTELCRRLARMIAQDGEGAKKLITVEVTGARTPSDADRAARAIANSPLVKTAIAGSDPNWGRIIAAAGHSGARFNPNRVDIWVNNLLLCQRGLDAGFDETAAKHEFDKKEITLRIDFHQGDAATQILTCDLTEDYIRINASYRT